MCFAAELLSCFFITQFFLSSSRGYAGVGGPAFHLHSDVIMPYISHYGNKEQIEKYIPKMTSGELVSAIAMTEPDAGRYFVKFPPY